MQILMATKFKVAEHVLVPKHTRLSDKEKAELLEKYKISENELPRISFKDPVMQAMNVKPGDVVRIERESITTGVAIFFRRVS